MRLRSVDRRLVFALALAVLALGTLAASQFGNGPPPSLPADSRGDELDRSADGDSPAGATAAARRFRERLERKDAAQLREAENRSYTTRGAAEARGVASSFLRAYLRYAQGQLTQADRAALRRSASPGLAALLLRTPVRIPHGIRAPRERFIRLGSVRPASFGSEPGFSMAAVISRAGDRRVLGLSVVQVAGSWKVGEVGR